MTNQKNILSNTNCDFCNSNHLKKIYEVANSFRGMIVAACKTCGLVQSIQTREQETERIVRASSGADWGNIRHGKGLRLNAMKNFLDTKVDWDRVQNILDIGSNRGDFVTWINKRGTKIKITAVEPDGQIINDYKNVENIQLIQNRFEKVDLQKSYYGFVYCSHTLEHAASASEMIKKINSCMKNRGLLFLEVPNIELISEKNTIEEFFIDKHTFHFNHAILKAFLETSSFKILHDKTDFYNICFLLEKTGDIKDEMNFSHSDTEIFDKNLQLIQAYVKTFTQNIKDLSQIGEKINPFLERQNVAFWGGGRIFDALIKYGNLKLDLIQYVVDEYLSLHMSETNGIKLKDSKHLRITQPQVVIILARSSTDEIEKKIRSYGIRNVIKFQDLMDGFIT